MINIKKAIIYMEVMCDKCNCVKNGYYHNNESIRNLKRVTKDWVYISEYGNLCPECYQKIKETDK